MEAASSLRSGWAGGARVDCPSERARPPGACPPLTGVRRRPHWPHCSSAPPDPRPAPPAELRRAIAARDKHCRQRGTRPRARALGRVPPAARHARVTASEDDAPPPLNPPRPSNRLKQCPAATIEPPTRVRTRTHRPPVVRCHPTHSPATSMLTRQHVPLAAAARRAPATAVARGVLPVGRCPLRVAAVDPSGSGGKVGTAVGAVGCTRACGGNKAKHQSRGRAGAAAAGPRRQDAPLTSCRGARRSLISHTSGRPPI
jgi:hypothetical protein